MKDSNWKITVDGSVQRPFHLTWEAANDLDDQTVQPGERVPGLEGEAFSLKSLLEQAGVADDVTHLIFHATDEFQADIPLGELEQAFLLYSQEGRPLTRAYPARLYVPDGSSNCLNVKSVRRIQAVIRTGHEAEQEASFGFKQVMRPDDIRKV
ncbi:molybdopterin-dependent oxidoreductase [Paludifilum halophilum]|uniref:molybdopterin-dependent oxidoreductase n=1 Tax=Paludifilum halophilum TaxID=1642702 RepID=UPI00146AD64F|nr:molybdopterin-dependent oxidoreductase [Paludifilum halophilum]